MNGKGGKGGKRGGKMKKERKNIDDFDLCEEDSFNSDEDGVMVDGDMVDGECDRDNDEFINLRPKTLEELIHERNIIDDNYGMISDNEKCLNQYAEVKEIERKEVMQRYNKKNIQMNITIL